VRDLLAIGGLLLLTVLVFGGHVRRGFFVADDWFYNAVARFGGPTMGLHGGGSGTGFTNTVDALFHVFDDRPTLPFVFAATNELFGLHMKLYVALSVAAGFVMAAALYALLRALRIERVHSFAIAALVLLFPFADAPRLWGTGIQATLAVIVFLAGLTLAIIGLRSEGRRGVALHVAAVLLYILSVLTYQLTFGLVLASGLVYVAMAPGRRALVLWAIDAGVVVLAARIAASVGNRAVESPTRAHRLSQLFHSTLDLLPAAASPRMSAIGSTPLTVALLVVPLIGAVIAWRMRGEGELRRWTLVACVSVAMIAGGYVALLPTEGYNALDVGIGNRVNLAGSLGMVALVYADLMIVSLLVMRGPLRPLRIVPVLIVAALIALGYRDLEARHQRDYRQAYTLERVVIGAMLEVRAPPPKDAVLYVVGHPFYVNGVPVFSRTFDTRAAATIYLDPSFKGVPLAGLAKLVCRRHDVYPPGWGIGARAAYGKAVVVDVAAMRVTWITGRARCLRGGFPLTSVPG
jgi:hypothetical protein